MPNTPPNTPRSPKSVDVLRKILEDAHAARLRGERVLTVFDLDSTLFDLTPRIQRIVDLFACDAEMKEKFAAACVKLNEARILPQDWGIQEALERVGLMETDHPDFYRELHEHWAAHFFSNRHLLEDIPLPGAVEFVQALERENAQVMYLTGRDTQRMKEGTIASLRQWQFPLDREHTQLVLKPDANLDDAEFKLDVLREHETNYARVWLFENEPVNLNLIQKHLPQVQLVFIETTHSRREQVDAALARIPHFETDLQGFEAFKKKS